MVPGLFPTTDRALKKQAAVNTLCSLMTAAFIGCFVFIFASWALVLVSLSTSTSHHIDIDEGPRIFRPSMELQEHAYCVDCFTDGCSWCKKAVIERVQSDENLHAALNFEVPATPEKRQSNQGVRPTPPGAPKKTITSRQIPTPDLVRLAEIASDDEFSQLPSLEHVQEPTEPMQPIHAIDAIEVVDLTLTQDDEEDEEKCYYSDPEEGGEVCDRCGNWWDGNAQCNCPWIECPVCERVISPTMKDCPFCGLLINP